VRVVARGLSIPPEGGGEEGARAAAGTTRSGRIRRCAGGGSWSAHRTTGPAA